LVFILWVEILTRKKLQRETCAEKYEVIFSGLFIIAPFKSD
jgi:hypothetical protein